MYAFKKKTLKVIHVRLTLSYNRLQTISFRTVHNKLSNSGFPN